MGSDYKSRNSQDNQHVSIHTPAWGVTDRLLIFDMPKKSFNPHSRMGSDFAWLMVLGVGIGFNPHSRMGSDITIYSLKL